MKKEVYKRKPKKAFKKIKKRESPGAKPGSEAGHKASAIYHEIRFKPAYKRTWFWVLALIISDFPDALISIETSAPTKIADGAYWSKIE